MTNEEFLKKHKRYLIAQSRAVRLKGELENEVYRVARQVDDYRDNKKKGITYSHGYDDFEIEGDHVIAKWEDWWAYGGQDSDTTIFPIKLLGNQAAVDDYIIYLNKEIEKEKERKRLKEIEVAKETLKRLQDKIS